MNDMKINVIVSTKEDIFPEDSKFSIVSSFKSIRALNIEAIDTIIINSSTDEEFSAGVFISEFYTKGVKNFIYINENPSPVIKTCIKGVNGVIIEDEFYLEDEEELICLIKDLSEDEVSEDTSLTTSNLNIIGDFLKSFARGEERIKSPIYLEQVNQALDSIVQINRTQELQIKDMGTSAITVFNKANTIIQHLSDSKDSIEKQLKELEYSSEEHSTGRVPFSNMVNTFNAYKYMGIAKVFLIKEYTPCKYLTSFCLSYLHHLKYVKNKRVKLVFLHLKGTCVSGIYNDFTSISQDSMGMTSLYEAPIVATNSPKKEVMKELLNKGDDYVIVVDRMYGKDDMVTGRGIVRLNAVSGLRDIDKFKLNAEETISSVVSSPNMFATIPTIKNYPTNEDTQYSTYNQVMQDVFVKLDNKLNVK